MADSREISALRDRIGELGRLHRAKALAWHEALRLRQRGACAELAEAMRYLDCERAKCCARLRQLQKGVR